MSWLTAMAGSAGRALVRIQGGDRLAREVAPAHQPFVVLLDEQHAGQPHERGVVGVDADHVRAPADLAVDSLERVGIQYESPDARLTRSPMRRG
jgi:hypothetical protein